MKMPIRVYNKFLDLLSETDSYQSLQFKRSFHGVGDFELHINRYMHGADNFQKGNIIALNKQSNKVGIILSREIELDESGKETENFKLTGTTLDGLMNRRITEPPSGKSHDRKSGNAEMVMKHYVYNNFVIPENRKRIVDALEIAPNKNRGKQVTRESRYKAVSDELEAISIETNLGWGVFADFNTKKLIFDCFESKDLTQNNSQGNSPVFFSPEFETIKSQGFIDSDLDLRNVGYVGGQGEGKDRKIVTIGDTGGWERMETFVDARDVGTEDEDEEEELTEEEIVEMLTDRGNEKLSEMETVFSLEAQILTPVTQLSYNKETQQSMQKQVTPFQYEKDFDLGDKVQVVNKSWGLTMTAPITEFLEIHEQGGFKLEATFGQSRPTLITKIKDKFDELEGIEKQEAPAMVAVEKMREAINYSDSKLSDEERKRIEQAKANLESSKEYADEQDTLYDNIAKEDASKKSEQAKEHADEQDTIYDGIAKEDAKNKANQAESNANNYTNTVGDELRKGIGNTMDAIDVAMKLVDADMDRIENEVIPEVEQTIKENNIPKQNTPPETIPTSNLWWDTSVKPSRLKRWNDSTEQWLPLAPTNDDIDDLIQDMKKDVLQEGKQYTKEEIQAVEKAILDELKSQTGDISEHIESLDELADNLKDHANKVDELINEQGNKVSKMELDIDEVDNKITATVEDIERIDDITDANSTQIGIQAGRLEAKLDSTTYETDKSGILSDIEANKTLITATSERVDLSVTKEEFEALSIGGRNLLRSYDAWTRFISSSIEIVSSYEFRIVENGNSSARMEYTVDVEPHTDYTISAAVTHGRTGVYTGDGETLVRLTNGSIKITFNTGESTQVKVQHGKYSQEMRECIFKYSQLEKGNKATAWRPAEEDRDAQFESISDRITKTQADISVLSDSVSLKAEKDEVYTRSQIDSSLGKKIDESVYSKKVGELTTSIDGISGRVSDVNSVVDKLSGDITSTQSDLAALDVKAGKIEANVSSISSDLDSTSSALAALEIETGKISSSVSDVRIDLDGLEIGGRNLITNTSNKWENVSWSSWNAYPNGNTYSNRIPATPNQVYTFSVEYKDVKTSDSVNVGVRIFGVRKDGRRWESSNGQTSVKNGGEGYASIVVKIPSDVDEIYPVLRKYSSRGSSSAKYRLAKLEKGNKATDWTPAPEDMDDRMTSAESSIEQTARDIELKVDVDGVVNAVNLSKEGLKIDASKIDIKGLVSFINSDGSTGTAINGDKIVSGSVTAKELNVNNIFGNSAIISKIQSDSVKTANLSASQITAGTFDAGKISVVNLSASSLVAGEIDAAKVNIRNINAEEIKTGILTGVDITGVNITGSRVESGDGNGNSVRLENGEIYSEKGSQPLVSLNRQGLTIYGYSGEEVGTIRNSEYSSDGSVKGYSINSAADFLHLGFGSVGETSRPNVQMVRDGRESSTAVFGSNDNTHDSGKITMRAVGESPAHGVQTAEVRAVNKHSNGINWGGVHVQTGRGYDDPAPSSRRFGFEVWQFVGNRNNDTGKESDNTLMLDVDTDSDGYTYTSLNTDYTTVKAKNGSKWRVPGLYLTDDIINQRGVLHGSPMIYVFDRTVSMVSGGSGAYKYGRLDIGVSWTENIWSVHAQPMGAHTSNIVVGIENLSASGFRVFARGSGGSSAIEGERIKIRFLALAEPKP